MRWAGINLLLLMYSPKMNRLVQLKIDIAECQLFAIRAQLGYQVEGLLMIGKRLLMFVQIKGAENDCF